MSSRKSLNYDKNVRESFTWPIIIHVYIEKSHTSVNVEICPVHILVVLPLFGCTRADDRHLFRLFVHWTDVFIRWQMFRWQTQMRHIDASQRHTSNQHEPRMSINDRTRFDSMSTLFNFELVHSHRSLQIRTSTCSLLISHACFFMSIVQRKLTRHTMKTNNNRHHLFKIFFFLRCIDSTWIDYWEGFSCKRELARLSSSFLCIRCEQSWSISQDHWLATRMPT
jgi:hypothetical protein